VGVDYLRLDPSLTAVSLERIRRVILAELGIDTRWQGRITVTTYPVTADDPRVRIASVRYNNAWAYQVRLPERIDRALFMRVAVEVILREIANRAAGQSEADLPSWLVVGLTEKLQNEGQGTLALEPALPTAQQQTHRDPLRKAREILRDQVPLKFDDLSMPTEQLLSGSHADLYRACAHVFTHELMLLKNGRQQLRDMLLNLGRNLNWQTCFLNAFSGHFPSLLAADKWYSLALAGVQGQDLMSVWPMEAGLKQLDQILGTTVEVRLKPDELPIKTTVTLQRVIREWDFSRQQPVMIQKLNLLEALRLRSPPELLGLIVDYSEALRAYAIGRRGGGPRSSPGRGRVRELASRLDELDQRRVSLRQELSQGRTSPEAPAKAGRLTPP
jgi:hypothetical protein